MKKDTPRTCPAAAKLREAAAVWTRTLTAPCADANDSASAAADRALRRAAERYTDAARRLRARGRRRA